MSQTAAGAQQLGQPLDINNQTSTRVISCAGKALLKNPLIFLLGLFVSLITICCHSLQYINGIYRTLHH